ncbi:T9SS sorting signal type C domain-containing protein [Flavobacterium sp. P21]|uniref:T9SS sorting signal type C domain-containing protein n=1 Tax=Flavobacterium sp. P21 TaxID=3423948 RepID=UPI003D67113B
MKILRAPIIASLVQPNCTIPTGSVVLNGLPASGFLLVNDGTTTTRIPFSSSTISGLAPGSYRFAVDNGCAVTYSATPITIGLNTWNGSTWSYNTNPGPGDAVNFAGDYNITGDQEYCSLTVSNNAVVTVASEKTLTVQEGVHVIGSSSKLVFMDKSSLLQTSTSNTINTGNINYNRITGPIRKADYVYWSTPVKNQTLLALSPLTRAGLYYTHEGSGWINVPSSSTMVPGKGYIIRAPETHSATVGTSFPATFIGTPNNGLVTTGVNGGTFCLIGNPYPSALDADKFLGDNISILTGTIYFWTHNTYAGTGTTAKYTVDDYASYNLSGGVDTKPVASMPSAAPPSGNIVAGQGFFAGVTTTGSVFFDNSMRLGGNANGEFYKPGKGAKTAKREKNRVWLNMTNLEGVFKQILVGYIEGATNSYEGLFDGETFDGNKYLDFYSVNENRRLTIQGRALPFEDTDTVPLGYKTTIVGDFTIGIDHADGNLSTQKIYLEDKKTGTVHDLGQSNYTFTTEAGTFTDRFILRYTNKTLGTGDFENIENGILVSVKDKVLKVISSKEAIKDVTIYDINGKLLYTKTKVSSNDLQISNLNSSNQVLIVKVTLENDFTVSKKIIFN